MWQELDDFHKTLEHIENALYVVAAHNAELKAYGLRRLVRRFDLEELVPTLSLFPLQLTSCKKIIDIADKKRGDELSALLSETKLEDLITRFTVKLRIASNEKYVFSPLSVVYAGFKLALFRNRTSDLFSNNDISMESLLAATARIKSLIKVVSSNMRRRDENDEEVFKPSNIDIQKVSSEIDLAIESIVLTESINSKEKDNLIEFLKEAKEELVKKDPSWRKVVGALVIVSTILGGAAIAPQAHENVRSAVKYILGTSIQEEHTNEFSFPRKTEQDKHERNDKPPEIYTT